MKGGDFIKKKSEKLAQAQHQFEFTEWIWISPTIRDYGIEFLNRANSQQLIGWVREYQLLSNGTLQP